MTVLPHVPSGERAIYSENQVLAAAYNVGPGPFTRAQAAATSAGMHPPQNQDAGMDDQLTYVYATGVMAEVIRELANLAEREINRNA